MTLWLEGYQDVCNELELMKIYEIDLRKRVEIAHKVVVSGEMQSDAHYVHIPLDKSIEWYNDIVDKYRKVVDRVNEITSVKVQMERHVDGFTGNVYKMAYMRVIEGKSIDEIANNLHLSYHHVASSLSRNKVKKHKNITRKAV